jgi:hypothetical protein
LWDNHLYNLILKQIENFSKKIRLRQEGQISKAKEEKNLANTKHKPTESVYEINGSILVKMAPDTIVAKGMADGDYHQVYL